MMTKISYSGYRFPPEIIQQTIWLYLRFGRKMPSPGWIGITWRHSRRSVERRGPVTSDWCRPSAPMLESSNFYLRTKGEAEAAVRACGYLRVDNARPSFLLGQRAEARTGERVGIVAAKMVAPLLIGPLMIYHPIPAASVARALVNLNSRDERGVFIQQYSELVAAA